jgi:hypothetical protein
MYEVSAWGCRGRMPRTSTRTFTQCDSVLPQHRRHITGDGGQALEGALTQAVRLPLHRTQQRGQQLRPRLVAHHTGRLTHRVSHLRSGVYPAASDTHERHGAGRRRALCVTELVGSPRKQARSSDLTCACWGTQKSRVSRWLQAQRVPGRLTRLRLGRDARPQGAQGLSVQQRARQRSSSPPSEGAARGAPCEPAPRPARGGPGRSWCAGRPAGRLTGALATPHRQPRTRAPQPTGSRCLGSSARQAAAPRSRGPPAVVAAPFGTGGDDKSLPPRRFRRAHFPTQ